MACVKSPGQNDEYLKFGMRDMYEILKGLFS